MNRETLREVLGRVSNLTGRQIILELDDHSRCGPIERVVNTGQGGEIHFWLLWCARRDHGSQNWTIIPEKDAFSFNSAAETEEVGEILVIRQDGDLARIFPIDRPEVEPVTVVGLDPDNLPKPEECHTTWPPELG